MAMTRRAFTSLYNAEGEIIIGLAVENEAGYYPQPNHGTFRTKEEAQVFADVMNKAIFNLDPKLAWMIVLSSMYPLSEEEHVGRVEAWKDEP